MTLFDIHYFYKTLQLKCFVCITPTCLLYSLKMEPIYSSKRKKLAPYSEIHSSGSIPLLVTPSAQDKYRFMRYNLSPGIGVAFCSFPEILDHLKAIGWESLVIFTDRNIYPFLIAEFYTHMVFNRDLTGLLTSISTCIQGKDFVINEDLLIHALHLHPSMLELPKINEYLHPLGTTMTECMLFKQNLSFTSDQLVPAVLFDVPVNVDLKFLSPACQFLGKILRYNFMPVREDRTMHPFDLEIIKCIMNECMPYNLAYFLLTSFEHCFNNNCLGFGLLLTRIFNYLEIDLTNHQFQAVQNTNIVSRLHIPPTPLIVFKPCAPDTNESDLHMSSQLDVIHSMNQLMLFNLNNVMVQMETMQQLVHHLQDMLHFLMENMKLSMPPYHFPASSSTTQVAPTDPLPFDDALLNLGHHFSPLNEEDY